MQYAPTIQKPKARTGPLASRMARPRPGGQHPVTARIHKSEEKKADDFANKAISSEKIIRGYKKFSPVLAAATRTFNGKPAENHISEPVKLSAEFSNALHEQSGGDFSNVEIIVVGEKGHDEIPQAAAFTSGQSVFLRKDFFSEASLISLWILVHELYHALQHNHVQDTATAELKPVEELNDRTPEQQKALERAAAIALNEQGAVNSNILQDDNTRLGWEHLLDYFKKAFGEENIVETLQEHKPGKLWADVIKYVKRGQAQKVKVVDGKHVVTTENNVDLLPSWCGIFVFWALHKAGIHPPLWKIGQPNITANDAFRKGEYLPRPGDIVIKNGFNHFAMVVRTIPENIADTNELKSIKVVTINGNTAGSNHLGGQVQEKTDNYDYWDFYINPFFSNVRFNPDEVPETESPGGLSTPGGSIAQHAPDPSVNEVNTYDTSIPPAPPFFESAEKAGEIAEAGSPEAETGQLPPVEPDAQFNALKDNLKSNAAKTKKHDKPENKAAEAANSAISPDNERISKAKAGKIQEMGELPAPKPFEGAILKKSILDEVEKLLNKKKEEAGRSGNIPKINNQEVTEVKEKNSTEIKEQKTSSVGPVEEAQDKPPDESAVETRENTEVIKEDPGKKAGIQNTDDAVAKPIAEERITLEEESASIDRQMEENEVTEQQLEESEEEHFTSALGEKKASQAGAASVKEDYRAIEEKKLEKDKAVAKKSIAGGIEKIHGYREENFKGVDLVKDKTKSADEVKRKEIADKIEGIYTSAETSVNKKLDELDKTVNDRFDRIMGVANDNFKKNVNEGMDDEFTSETVAKWLDEADFNRRVKKVFDRQSEKYKTELSASLDPLTNHIADTLNAIIREIKEAKDAVMVFVRGLPEGLQQMATESAAAVMEKFSSLEESVDQKQQALVGSLAQKYADGVGALEEEFKKIMDSRKSWLEKALDAVVGVIKEIINLVNELRKALARAAEYASRIIKAPVKFFGNLASGVSAGFDLFVKNIGKHFLNGALEWITGQMGEAGIKLPEKFDFRGILSLVLQVLGITVEKVREIARKVIGKKYVDMLEKGVELGKSAGAKIFKLFTILKTEGISGLWEFIKEQFFDLKEQLLEQAKSFILVTVIEKAVIKIASMLIPGAGFISAVKSIIDFVKTLFERAKQIIQLINGILDTFGEILAGNVGRVAAMVENVLAKFLGLAITFLANMLGLGGVGKKIADIIQKKIKEPIANAITKVMEKLKMLMTKLGIFKLLDKVDEKIKKGKAYVDEKKEKAKAAAKKGLDKFRNFLKNLFTKYKDQNGETHTLRFRGTELVRESVSVNLGNYLISLENVDGIKADAGHTKTLKAAQDRHKLIVKLIGDTVKKVDGTYEGSDKYFSENKGEELRKHLAYIADKLRLLPLGEKKNLIPETIIDYADASDGLKANAQLISLHSKDHSGSKARRGSSASDLTKAIKTAKNIQSSRVIQGHLINHELFGTGKSGKNLAPIPHATNMKMLDEFETTAKTLVHTNNIIALQVEMHYNLSNYGPLKKHLEKQLPGQMIPEAVTYNLKELQFSGKANAAQEEINKPANWNNKKGGFAKSNAIPIDHKEFF